MVHAGIAQGGHYYSFVCDSHAYQPSPTPTSPGTPAGAGPSPSLPVDSTSSSTSAGHVSSGGGTNTNTNSSNNAPSSDANNKDMGASVAPPITTTKELKWYRFDDEDVSHFKPEHIPAQCFGGPPSANGQGR